MHKLCGFVRRDLKWLTIVLTIYEACKSTSVNNLRSRPLP